MYLNIIIGLLNHVHGRHIGRNTTLRVGAGNGIGAHLTGVYLPPILIRQLHLHGVARLPRCEAADVLQGRPHISSRSSELYL
jgi:hypothetical protein